MADLETFRAETRAWLEANCPAECRGPMADDEMIWGGRNPTFKTPAHKLWLERMAARGCRCSAAASRPMRRVP